MTGFAAVARELPLATLVLELRSVNSRFLDVVFKIPDDFRVYEPALRERLAGPIKRGKVECRIAFQRRGGNDRQTTVDEMLVASLVDAGRRISRLMPEAAPMTVTDLLRWPGVIAEDRFDTQALGTTLESMLAEALSDFTASRRREGAKAAGAMIERVDTIEKIVADVQSFMPAQLQQFEDRLVERLKAALTTASDGTSVSPDETFGRMRQEITLYGLRIDVAEELSRLAGHASELRRALKAGGTVGKRLDFLMQEMNREANTLGSKSSARELTQAAMELKLAIEQIREQVQNVE